MDTHAQTLPNTTLPDRVMADTSLEAFDHIKWTLQEREIATFLLICDYLEATEHDNVTGGELAEWSKRPVTHLRPRITGLVTKGWLYSLPRRSSRAKDEMACHPITPALPREAVERVQRVRQKGSEASR